MKNLYAAHRWLGLVALGQVSIWFFTGLVMSSLPIRQVRGDETRAMLSTPPIDWERVVMPPSDTVSGAEEVSLRMLDGVPVYEVRGKETRLLDATSGRVVEVDAARAGRIALADQQGPPSVIAIERLETPTVEYREKPVPAWAVHLADDASTTVYVDARNGRVSARRNNSWRVFDFVWGLHIMDWRERKDFNTLLLSVFAAAALAMAVSGGAIWVSGLSDDGGPERWSRFLPLAPISTVRISLLTLFFFVVLGCNPLPEPISPSDAGADAGTGTAAPVDAGPTGSDGGADAGTPDAGIALPVVTSAVVVVHGSIRVQWTNPTPACDTLALMRSKDGAAAVVASQPASSATEVVDAPGHSSGTFCYSLTCSRGGAARGSSNQKCATQ